MAIYNEIVQRKKCKMKARYPTRSQAKKKLKFLKRRHHGEQSIYLCPICEDYHLTHLFILGR